MADRETGVVIRFTTDASQAREQYEAFVRDITSKPVSIPYTLSRGGQGGGTFSGATTEGGPNAEEAGSLLSRLSIARNTGPSLAMQNGSPGAQPGGLANDSAASITREQTNVRQALPEGMPDKTAAIIQAAGAGISRLPSTAAEDRFTDFPDYRSGTPRTALDRQINQLEESRVAAVGARNTPDEDAYGRQYNRLYDRAVDEGLAEGPRQRPTADGGDGGEGFWTRPIHPRGNVTAGILGVAAVGRIAATEGTYQSSLITAGGSQRAIAEAELGRARDYATGFDPFGLPLGSGIAAVTGSTQSIANSQRILGDADASNSYVDLRRTLGIRDANSYDRSAAEAISYSRGAYSGSLAENSADLSASKRAADEAQTSDPRLTTLLGDRTAAANSVFGVQENAGDDNRNTTYSVTRNGEEVGKTYDTRDQAESAARSESIQSVSQLDAAIQKLRSEIAKPFDEATKALVARRDALVRQRDGQILGEQSGLRAGEDALNRNNYGSLYESTIGQGYAAARAGPPEDFFRTVANAGVRFTQGTRTIARDNREATYDQTQETTARRQAFQGDDLQSDLTRIEAGRQQQLRAIGGTGLGFLDNLLGYTARRESVNAQANEGTDEAKNRERQRIVGSAGDVVSAAYQLNDDPYDAKIARITADSNEQISGADGNSPKFQRATRAYEASVQLARQQDRNQNKLVDIGLTYSGIALDRQLARDPIGAESATMAGDLITQGNQLAFAGRFKGDGGAAREQEFRSQASKRFDLESQNYADSFRAEVVDPRDVSFSNARDSQDPSQVFAEIAKNQLDTANTAFGSDSATGGMDVSGIVQGITGGNTTLADVVTQLKSLVGE